MKCALVVVPAHTPIMVNYVNVDRVATTAAWVAARRNRRPRYPTQAPGAVFAATNVNDISAIGYEP